MSQVGGQTAGVRFVPRTRRRYSDISIAQVGRRRSSALAGTKNLLLRLDPELAAQLQIVADIEKRPMSEVVREAIRTLIEARREDADFQQRLRQSAREHGRTIRALKAADDG